MSTPSFSLPRMDRRSAIKWMLAGAAAMALRDTFAFGSEEIKRAEGYGTDPDLVRDYQPGALWPLTFTEAQRRTAAALCDVIIPEDAKSPAASSLGVHDFIDEWISAPYPLHRADRDTILDGLAWLDEESKRRFHGGFSAIDLRQKRAICDEICRETKPAGSEKRLHFFRKFRDLTAGGFYTTREGMVDIGYVGNIPLLSFDGPPRKVLARLGLS
jgi:hypothetical protein